MSDAAGLRRLLLNGASLLGAYVLPRACTFAAAVVAARTLGVEAFGAYGTAAALAVLLSIVATMGMMQLLVREMSRTPERSVELLGAANVTKAVSGAAMLGCMAILVNGLLDYPPAVAACALLLAFSYAVGSWAENLGAYFQAAERMQVWMQAQALFGLVGGSAAMALALGTRSVVWFCAAPALGQIAALGWLLLRAPTRVRWAWRAPRALVASLLRSLVPFTVSVVALTAYAKVDVLLVERLRGVTEAGIYAAAYKFVDVAQALALVVATAVFPRLSRAVEGVGKDRAASRTAELLLLAGVPAAALLWLLREPLVGFLFGPAYGPSAEVLGLLAPALPVLAVNVLGAFVMAADGRMVMVAALYGGALALDVFLDLLLVPGMGAAGAAAARLASELALGVAMSAALHRLTGVSPSLRVAAAAATVGAAAALLRWPALPPPEAAALHLAASVAVYTAVRVVPRREWALLRRAVKR